MQRSRAPSQHTVEVLNDPIAQKLIWSPIPANGSQHGLVHVGLCHDNVRAVLEWSKVAAPDVCLRLATGWEPFWAIRGYFAEGGQLRDEWRKWPRIFNPMPDSVRQGHVGPLAPCLIGNFLTDEPPRPALSLGLMA